MIVIRVEMWPHGNQERKYHLGSAIITNTGALGNGPRGNYEVQLSGKKGAKIEGGKIGKVENWARRQRNIWELIAVAIRSVLGERIDNSYSEEAEKEISALKERLRLCEERHRVGKVGGK